MILIYQIGTGVCYGYRSLIRIDISAGDRNIHGPRDERLLVEIEYDFTAFAGNTVIVHDRVQDHAYLSIPERLVLQQHEHI